MSAQSDNQQHNHATHANHPHIHGPGCGHTAIRHNGHVDYLHEGHLHHPHEGHVDEHRLEDTTGGAHQPITASGAGHDRNHQHGPGCGHEAVPHGDHVDYLVNGSLHHPHGDHCDDHGKVDLA